MNAFTDTQTAAQLIMIVGKNRRQTRDFQSYTFTLIKNAAQNPAHVKAASLMDAKAQAPFCCAHDATAKTKDAALEHDHFTMLWADLDTGNHTIADLQDRLKLMGIKSYAIYATASSTPEDRRWRVLVEIDQGIDFELWFTLQSYLAAKLKGDDCAKRPQQILYLPFKCDHTAHYEYATADGEPVAIGWGDLVIDAQNYREQVEAKELEKAASAPQAPRRDSSLSEGQQSPVAAFNAAVNLTDLLQQYGFRKVGRKYLHPNSKSGAPGVVVLMGRYYSHHSAETDPLADGHTHDAFDLFVEFEHGGDYAAAVKAAANEFDLKGQKQRQREFMAAKTAERAAETLSSFDDEQAAQVNSDAVAIAKQIKRSFTDMIGDDAQQVEVNQSVITMMITRSFWSGQKSKLFLLNRDEALPQFTEKEAFKFLARTFGAVVDDADIKKAAAATLGKLGEKDQEKLLGALRSAVRSPIIDHLKYTNQRETVAWAVDMFAQAGRIDVIEDKALVTLSHKPLKAAALTHADGEVIEDFKQHFTRFDEFLTFLVMARFAQDRKKAYLWIHADSDWGKGFLKSALERFGLSVELSVKEIERIFEGGPVAKSPADFKRAFALVVDEFKAVKSEIKQLERTMRISPKNQLQSEVEVFAKLFFSAEGVASLAGEHGVEDQFANRMSVFQETGNINEREVFRRVGSTAYLNSVCRYAAGFINNMVDDMRRKGRDGAAADAQRYLDEFNKRYGLDTVYQRFSESLPDIADDIVRWVKGGLHRHSDKVVGNIADGVYLKSARVVIGDYITEHYDQSQAGSLHHKKDIIMKLMSVDGKGEKSHRLNRTLVIKGVKLKN